MDYTLDYMNEYLIPETVKFIRKLNKKKLRIQVDSPVTIKANEKMEEYYSHRLIANTYIDFWYNEKIAVCVSVDYNPEYFYYDMIEVKEILPEKYEIIIKNLHSYLLYEISLCQIQLEILNEYNDKFPPFYNKIVQK